MRKTALFLMGCFVCGLLLQGCVEGASVREVPLPSTQSAIKPSPTPSHPAVREETAPPLQVTYDHGLLSSREIEILGEEKYVFYRELVENVLQHKTRILIPEGFRRDKSFRYVLNLFQKHCPLSYLTGTPYLSLKGDYVVFEYLFSKETHIEKARQLGRRVENIIQETVREGYSLLEATLSLYRYLAKTTDYHMQAKSTETYGVLMNQEGICTGFAYTMALLLRQAGYDDGYIVAYTPEDPLEEGHAWNVLPFYEKWYHVDTTWEHSGSFGLSLQYFGMTDAQREADGLMRPFNRDLLEDEPLFVPMCSDTSFAPIQTAVKYITDFSNHLLYVQTNDGKWFVFHTDTLQCELTAEPLLSSQ